MYYAQIIFCVKRKFAFSLDVKKPAWGRALRELVDGLHVFPLEDDYAGDLAVAIYRDELLGP